MLVELSRGTWINEKDGRHLLCEVGCVGDEVVGLLLAKRALVARISAQNDEHCGAFARLV